MGNLFTSLFASLFGSQDVRILILGLDGAGKTTILYKLQCGEVVTTIPTIGFNMETVTYKNVKLSVWDLGGQTSIRPYWRCYYSNTSAVIYVVDSADPERLSIVKEELLCMLEEEELRGVPLLILANKQDLPGALPAEKISEELGLTAIKKRPYQIMKASAIQGVGLMEGLDWVVNVIKAAT
eukprot:TRINITY_DN23635_c0_g1_i1.p1 TRINITY_DN23635_c0_g1~~TRINITY_DN23635_c0_g1_i1.p1  ORF type:complete len:182 (+),score=19.25 TRINITY_DN23635_c0_g1_i1:136-681(+)